MDTLPRAPLANTAHCTPHQAQHTAHCTVYAAPHTTGEHCTQYQAQHTAQCTLPRAPLANTAHCIKHSTLHSVGCPAHHWRTLHTVSSTAHCMKHCTLYTLCAAPRTTGEHCTPYQAQYIAQCTVHTPLCIKQCALYTLFIKLLAHCIQHPELRKLHSVSNFQHTASTTVHTGHCTYNTALVRTALIPAALTLRSVYINWNFLPLYTYKLNKNIT